MSSSPDDSGPMPLNKQRARIPALAVSEVVGLLLMLGTGAGLYAAMQAQQARMDVQITALKETVSELKSEVRDLRRALERK